MRWGLPKYQGLLGVVTLSLVSSAMVVPAGGQAVPQWRLLPPDFEVGGVGADAGQQLTSLGGVSVLPNGNVVVGDRAAPFLKVFAADGTHLQNLGRQGQGPGEYQYVYEIDWCAPDQLSVFDVDRRVHRYSADMVFVTTEMVSREAIGGGVGYNRDCHPNGFEVVTGWGDFRAQFRAGLYEATAPVVLLQGREVVWNFGERLSSQRIGSLRPDGSPAGSGPHPFGRATVVALGIDRLYIGDGSDFEIEVYSLAGDPLHPLRWEGPSLRYDTDLVEKLKDRAVSAASESRRAALRRWYADMPRLDQLPAYDEMLVSDRDELWVRQFVKPGSAGEEWVVFSADQRLVGRLTMPPRSTLWQVIQGRVVYSVLDEFDVPIVRISRVER